MEQKGPNNDQKIPWWVKSILLVGIAVVVCYKIVVTSTNLQFDFPTFLSLLLAVFSVGLAAMFYFKATDSSNAFYDNTYKFTRDIADLLVRIESGFGEKLRHLDEAYSAMQDRFDKLPSRIQIQDVKKEVKQEEEELDKIVQEKEQMIQELFSKAKLRDEEKQKFLEELKEKDKALEQSSQELRVLRHQLMRAEQSRSPLSGSSILRNRELQDYLRENLIDRFGRADLRTLSPREIIDLFDRRKQELPRQLLSLMRDSDMLDSDGDLTRFGIESIREIGNRSSPPVSR